MSGDIPPGVDKIKSTLDGTTGYGGEFLPVETANEIIKRVFDESWARNIFRSYPMSTETAKVPKIGSGGRMYGTTGNKNTEVTETRHGTTEVELALKTILGNHPIDRKTIAYAIGAMMGGLKEDIVDTVMETEEDVIINGDTETETTYSDNINNAYHGTNYPDGIVSQDARLELDGLRKWAIANEDDNSKFVNASGLALSTTMVRQAFGKLGKHGRRKSQLIILTSLSVANDILGWEQLETLEKYGPNATILTGEIGKVYGARVISTSLVPENLDADGVARTQVGADPENNRTVVLVFNYTSPIIGNPSMSERKFTVEIVSEPKLDQIVLLPREDIAFANSYPEAIVHIRNVLPGES